MNSSCQHIELPTGVSLQAELSEPLSASASHNDGNKLAVCLHPWSWLGGHMDDPVLLSLFEPLRKQNYHVIRFNSRGVGESTGWSSFTGFDEATDLKAIVQWGLQTVPDVRSIVLIGYSYGSLIASLHHVLPPPIKTSHVLISYPLSVRGWLTFFRTGTYTSKLKELIRERTANVMVVFGDRDEFTSIAKYEAWSKELEREAASTSSRLKVVKFANATHFWGGGRGRELGRVIEEWLP